MNILFVHQNFPGQFKHLAPAMARQGHRVVALHINACPPVPGVELVRYPVAGRPGQGTHRWVADLEVKTLRGEATWQAAMKLREQGFVLDVIVAHPGWGESLFLQQVWPQARLGIYCEFFYQHQGADVGFDPEFGNPDIDNACRLQMKNANYELHFARAHAGIAPTHWQASLLPEPFASRIAVVHDGIRTDQIRPQRPHPCANRARRITTGPRRRSHHLRQPQPGAVPRLSPVHAGTACHSESPPQSPRAHHRRQRGQLRRCTAAWP